MQQFVRRFVNQGDKLFRLRLAGKQGDLAAVAHAHRRGDSLVEFERDVLLRKKVNQPVALFAYFAGNVVLELRQFRALGLRHVEHMHGTETDKHRLRLGAAVRVGVLCGLGVLPPVADHRRENLDALLAALHEPAHLFPCAESRYARSGGPLPRNGNDVAKAVIVESRNRGQICGQCLALARFYLLDEEIHGLLDDELGWIVFLRCPPLIRRIAAVPQRRIFPVRRGVAGCAIAGGGCIADGGVAEFHDDAPA